MLARPVAVPLGILVSVLRKARTEYVAAAEKKHGGIPPKGECWEEFEQLAKYVPTWRTPRTWL